MGGSRIGWSRKFCLSLGLIEVIRKGHLTLCLLLPFVGSLVDMPLGTGTL